MIKKILIIGSGAWGTSIASHLSKQYLAIDIFTRNKDVFKEINNQHSNNKYLPNINLAKNIKAVLEFDGDYDYVFIATASSAMVDVLHKLSFISFKMNCHFIICTKGMVADSLEFFSNAFERIVNIKQYAILSGPNFAIEVAQELPTISTIACREIEIYKNISSIIDHSNFKSKFSHAIECTEICAVMKNIIAIGCGIIEGLEMGVNAKSALLVRGIEEIRQLCFALKIEEDLYGPAGIGDIFLTCSSVKSRNFSLGLLLANNQEIPKDVTYEGLNALNIIVQLAEKHNLKLDLCEVIHRIIHKEFGNFYFNNENVNDNNAKKLLVKAILQ